MHPIIFSISVLPLSWFLPLHSVLNPEFLIPALLILLVIFLVTLTILLVIRTREKKKYQLLLNRHLQEMDKAINISQENETQIQQLMGHFSEGLLLVNENGIVLFANKAACILSGVPYSKLIRQPLPAWLAGGSNNFVSIVKKLRKKNQHTELVQTTHCNKTFWLNAKWTWNLTPEGEPGAAITLTDVSEKMLHEEKIQHLTAETNEKSKQINCLFDISDISGVPDITFEGIMERSLQIIPSGLKFSHDAWVEIVFKDKRFVTPNFIETPWSFTSPIKIRKKKLGHLRVGYTEEKPKNMRDAFHLNEKLLIKNLAERLGQIIELANFENRVKELEEKK